MDLLFTLQGIAACVIVLGSILVVFFAVVLPKQRRGEVLDRIGRWFQGF
jgi:hypothetical protein